MTRKLLILAVFFAAVSTHAQTTLNLADCSQAQLNSKWGSMSSGAYILVFPSCAAGGTGNWTASLTLNAPPGAVTSVTLQGQTVVTCSNTPGTATYTCTSTDNTVITDALAVNQTPLVVTTGASATSFRLTALAIKTTGVAKDHGVVQFLGASKNFRIDHNHISTGATNISAMEFPGQLEGVIDHNLVDAVGNTRGEGFRVYNDLFDTVGNGDGGWMAATQWGSQHALFIESNYIKGPTGDCGVAGRVVWRYNTYSFPSGWPGGANGALHSTKFSQRGCRSEEFYKNYITAGSTPFALIGGEGSSYLAWGNVVGNFAAQWFYDGGLYRNGAGNNIPMHWGWCGTTTSTKQGTGGVTSAWDGNSSAATGYPCLDGLGRGQQLDTMNGATNDPDPVVIGRPGTRSNTTLGCTPTDGGGNGTGCSAWPHQYLEPMYLFMNTVWSTMSGMIITNDQSTQANRDIYGDCGPKNSTCTGAFTGAKGTGFGLFTARPSTCTAGPGGTYGVSPTGSYGVAYFATDQNRLYICTAANTWTFVYAPFVYPHPLVSGGASPSVSLSPSSVAFGNVLVGSTSPNTTVVLSNTGSGTLTITPPISLTGTNPADFSTSNNCGTAVLAGGNCSIVVSCTPASAASFSASVSITDNAAGSPHTIPLTCTGTTAAPGISFSPTSIAFAAQTVGTSSSPTSVTVTNTGSANLVITGIAISGGNSTSFSQTNNCGTVAPAGTCTINVTFKPQVAGALSSSVSVTDNAPASPQSVPLTGTGNGVAGIGFNPTAIVFGSQTVGATSAALTTTVSNPGTASLTLSSVTLTGTNAADFAISANTCGGSLAVGASCVVSVTFTPGATGARAANLTFTDSAPASPQNVALNGTGTQAGTSFSPTSLSFGDQSVGTTSAALSTTLTNTGSATLTISSIALTGANASDFVISANTCGTTLAPSATCNVSITFSPSVQGARTANISFTDNAQGSPQTVPLSGNGTPGAVPVALTPASLLYPATMIGQTSASQSVVMLNLLPDTDVTGISISVLGGNAADFTSLGNCPGTLPGGASCSVGVTFHPTTTGTRSSALVFSYVGTGSPQSVPLSGTGTQSGAQVSPATITFAPQPVGTTSAAQTVTLTNNGTATLNISNISLRPGDTYFAISANTCGSTLAANASCTVSETFTPATAGNFTSLLSFTDDGPNSPQTVSGSGTGTTIALSFNPTSLSFPNTPVSTASAPLAVTVLNTGNGTVTFSSISITGTNAGDFAQTNNCGTSLIGGGSCILTAKFTPSATGSRSASITLTDNAPGSPQTVSLQGTGYTPAPAVTLSTTSVAFGNQTVSTQSNAQVVIVTNSGTASLTISTATMGGSNPGDFGFSTTCGSSLAVNASCTYSLHFTPTAAGSRSATFSINTNAASSPNNVSLAGTGITTPPGAPAPQVFGDD